MNFRNTTLNNESRAEFGSLAIQQQQDIFFLDNMAVENSFFERNKYRNYYEGSTKISNAYFEKYFDKESQNMHIHGLDTSTTSGFIKTPGFGEPFDAKMFQLKANYWYTIYLPSNLSIIAANIPNLTLVMQLDVDVGLYVDTEQDVEMF